MLAGFITPFKTLRSGINKSRHIFKNTRSMNTFNKTVWEHVHSYWSPTKHLRRCIFLVLLLICSLHWVQRETPPEKFSKVSFYLKNNCFPKHATTLTVSEINIKKGEWFLVCQLKISYMIKVMTSYIVFFFSKTITSPSFNFIPKEFEILGGCTRGMSLLRTVYVKRALHTKGSQSHLLAQS